MKAIAKTRDIDIVSKKIEHKNAEGEYNALLKKLNRLRESSVRTGLARARALNSDPRLPVRIRGMSRSNLQRRFEKLSKKYAARIEKRLPRVLASAEEKEELHRLREEARRLRYTLEFGDKESDGNRLKVLRSWQDVLGGIHDSDIFIQYFEGSESAEERSLVEDEIIARSQNYGKFRLLANVPFRLESS